MSAQNNTPATASSKVQELPTLQLRFVEDGPKRCGSKFEIEAVFVNPLAETLTNCKFNFKGPGLQRPISVDHWDIPPSDEVVKSFVFRPIDPGDFKISVDFQSQQLAHAKGDLQVQILE